MTKIQGIFAAHPPLLEQFPGGIVEFAQIARNLPEEVLQEILVNPQILEEAAEQGGLPHGEMPGGLPGDNFVQLDFGREADVEGEDPVVGGASGGEALPVQAEEEDYEEEDEDVEEVGIFLLPLLSSVLNCLRLDRSPFVCCVIWSVVSGVVPISKRKTHQKTDQGERLG